MIHHLATHSSVFNQFLLEIRDEEIQKDSMRFRKNLERIGEVMAYEISKSLVSVEKEVVTPLGVANVNVPNESIVIGAVLRAALPMHQGFLNFFDKAENAFVAAYRRHHKGGEFEIEVDYTSSPSLEGKTLILLDPMLATGSSLELAYKSLVRKGQPQRVIIAAIIASRTGLNHLRSKMPESTSFWIGDIDDELTAQAYIVPGLGDAGDLAFGGKA